MVDLPLQGLLLWQVSDGLPQTNFLLLAVIALAAGFLSFASPCTLPVLPAYFAFTFQSDRKRITLMTVAFFLGLATVFAVLGAASAAVGEVLQGVGLDLSSLLKIAGLIVIFFGFMTLIGKGFSGITPLKRQSASFGGSYLFGAMFAIGWTSCVGPILSGILALASTEAYFNAIVLLLIFAFGLGSPLILMSAIFGRVPEGSRFWRFIKGKAWTVRLGGREFLLHSNNVLSGVIFIILGLAMALGYLTYLNSLVPQTSFFVALEEKLISIFN